MATRDSDAKGSFFTPSFVHSHVRAADATNVMAAAAHDEARHVGTSSVGIMTSGGDSPGMNAAVRSATRTALLRGYAVWGIREGYQGLIDNHIDPLTWDSVAGILHMGGTVLGTARCLSMKTRDGMKLAVQHLVQRRITNLVVIGGDGSLTGAHALRSHWSALVADLVKEDRVTPEQATLCARLSVVGLVGSIDNDFVGPSSTIGADTALNRIVHAIDCIGCTAASHKRTFIVEVMGRNCGWLALMATLVTGADYVLLPEDPPPDPDWATDVCRVITKGRTVARRMSIIILCEGAVTCDGVPITAAMVATALKERIGYETRTTTLGHVQRGGSPTAYDRYQGTLLGWSAVGALGAAEPIVLGLDGLHVMSAPLMECVNNTKAVADAMASGDYAKAQAFRGPEFEDCLAINKVCMLSDHGIQSNLDAPCIGIMISGAVAPGCNAAVRVATRLALAKGYRVFGISNGFHGLIHDIVKPLEWMTVNGWAPHGGAFLGTSRRQPTALELAAADACVRRHRFTAIIAIGGLDAYQGAHTCHSMGLNMPAGAALHKVRWVVVPATISNNTPATEVAVGMDRALENLVDATDKIKQSMTGYGKRVFVVECMGRRCGFLALVGALISGAEGCYLPEQEVRLQHLQADLAHMRHRFTSSELKCIGLFVNSEGASTAYSTAFVTQLFSHEVDGIAARSSILGNYQQGGHPTPLDRIRASRMAAAAVEWIHCHTDAPTSPDPKPSATTPRHTLRAAVAAGTSTAVCVGLDGVHITFTPLARLSELVDAANRRPWSQPWYDTLMPIFADLRLSSIPREEDVARSQEGKSRL